MAHIDYPPRFMEKFYVQTSKILQYPGLIDRYSCFSVLWMEAAAIYDLEHAM